MLVALCALLLIRGASRSAKVNTVMVLIKLTVLVMFSAIAFTAFDTDRFAQFAPSASPESARRPAPSSSPTSAWTRCPPPVTRSKIRRRPCRAILAALVTVTAVYVLVTMAALGTQPWQDFGGQEAGLATILDQVTKAHYWGTVLAAGR